MSESYDAGVAPADTVPVADDGRRGRWRAGVRWWLARYGAAEVAGIAAALAASLVAKRTTGNDVAAAYAASFAETAGYYTLILARELSQARVAGARGRALLARLRAVLLEFGPAELLDLLVLRPAALAGCTRALGRELGVPAGKVLADVVFYGTVVTSYRLQRATRTR